MTRFTKYRQHQRSTTHSEYPGRAPMKKKKAAADKSPVKTPVKSGPRRKATRKSADSAKSGQTGFKPDQTESVIEEFRRRWPELNQSRLEAHRQLRLVHDQLINKPGVTGLHVGLKKRANQPMPQATTCVRWYTLSGFTSVRNSSIKWTHALLSSCLLT